MDNVITVDYETAERVAAALNDKEQRKAYSPIIQGIQDTYPSSAYMPCEIEPDKWGILALGNGTASLVKAPS